MSGVAQNDNVVPDPSLAAAAREAAIQLVMDMLELYRHTRPCDSIMQSSGSLRADEQASFNVLPHTDAQLCAVLDELLRPELPQALPQPPGCQGIAAVAVGASVAADASPAGESGTLGAEMTGPSKAVTESVVAVVGATTAPGSCPNWSWWWEEEGYNYNEKGGSSAFAPSLPPLSLRGEEQHLQQHLQQQQQPPAPLSVGPCGLRHPGFLPSGYLRRPYALQLAWAAAVWRITGCFPYPVVRQQRPPLLRESDIYDATLSEVEALLPLLVPEPTAVQAKLQLLTGVDSGPGPGPPPEPGGLPLEATVCATRQGGIGAGAAVSVAGLKHCTWQTGAVEAAAPSVEGLVAPPITPATAAATARGPASALLQLLLNDSAVYMLLGFRLTAGSATRLVALPSQLECWEAFERRHALPGNGSILTVGARALSKHTHRDLRGEWWPRMSGSEAAKNHMARGSLERLMGTALWLNVHQLPPFDAPKYVLEVRNMQGYGARWAIENAGGRSENGGAGPPLPATVTGKNSIPSPAPPQQLQSVGPWPDASVSRSCAEVTLPGAGRWEKREVEARATEATPPATEATAEATALDLVAVPAARIACAVEAESSGTGLDVPVGSATVAAGTEAAAGSGSGSVTGQDVDQRPRLQFRGFLEPQMEGGHAAGWRH